MISLLRRKRIKISKLGGILSKIVKEDVNKMKKILLSTGIIFSSVPDINDRINILSTQNVNGFEIGYLHFEELNTQKLNKKSIDILKKYSNSFHAPGSNKNKYKDNNYFRGLLKEIVDLAKITNSKNITLHSNHIKDIHFVYDFLKKEKLELHIENVRPKEGYNIEEIKSIISLFPDIRFTFDTAHILEDSVESFNELAELLKNNIGQFHISLSHSGKFHNTVYDSDNNEHLKALKSIKKFNVQLILEESFRKGELDWGRLKKEIMFCKKEL